MYKRKMFGFIFCLTALGFSAGAFAELPPIKIGVMGPVTGKSSEDMGQSIVGGARVFLADMNQMGVILGRRVELVERDDQAKPDIVWATTSVQEVVNVMRSLDAAGVPKTVPVFSQGGVERDFLR